MVTREARIGRRDVRVERLEVRSDNKGRGMDSERVERTARGGVDRRAVNS